MGKKEGEGLKTEMGEVKREGKDNHRWRGGEDKKEGKRIRWEEGEKNGDTG
jgi:hypothetical protein